MTTVSRSSIVFLSDIALAAAAWYVAFLLRFNFSIPPEFVHSFWVTLPWVVAIQALVFRVLGLYQGIWRFASLPDLQQLVRSVAAAALCAPLIVLLGMSVVVPRSVYVLDPILLIILMGGVRFAYRAWREHREFGALMAKGKPVLVLGAGETAARLLPDISRSGQWRVVGLLDDNAKKHDRTLYGLRVLGPVRELERLSREMKVSHAIIAMPNASHEARRDAANACVRAGVKPMTVPSFDDLISGKVSVAAVREVEVEDLLGRDPVKIDAPRLRQLIEGQVVMVTGAGGSIGSELCRQIARFSPSAIVAFERGEFFLYTLVEEFAEVFPQQRIEPVIGDVRDEARLTAAMQQYRPVVVFHAAAYKHVPLMEGANAAEAVRNNVGGTLAAARAAQACGVPRFVLVSTDKAVNPVNVMGATKRLAEMACQALAARGGTTAFSTVRFGNVLGSAGSVIPRFEEQISRGGPVTVTHPEMVRYFMSIPEAAQLVLQAGCMGLGGEIFVMDMGEPVKIVDLARDMIRLSELSEEEIRIVYTGLRPGEKLFEELLADDEHTRPTPHPKLRVAKARDAQPREWVEELVAWLTQERIAGDTEVRRDLKRWVPEFQSQVRPKLKAVPGARAA